MFICIDCVVYNQFIIHDASPNSTMLEVLSVVGDSAGGPNFVHSSNMFNKCHKKAVFVIFWCIDGMVVIFF